MKIRKPVNRFLSLVLCICMVLSLVPIAVPRAEAAEQVQYIASIAVSYGSKASTPKNILKDQGYTVIDYDLNKGCGALSPYIYMGYKTTTDPSKAITGIRIKTGKNPANSFVFSEMNYNDSGAWDGTYTDATYNLLGGSAEPNPGENKPVDLNEGAGGDYIYIYVTRDSRLEPITEIAVGSIDDYNGYLRLTTDLNSGAGGDYIYLYHKDFYASLSATYYYLWENAGRTNTTLSGKVKHHLEIMNKVPSYATSVRLDGRPFAFKGWREDDVADVATTTSPGPTYETGHKSYRAVYAGDLILSYNANGGSGAPSDQTQTQYINAGSSALIRQSKTFTIPGTKPTPDASKCSFLGWSADSSATAAAYTPGSTISIDRNTTLYAVWKDHVDTDDGFCDACNTSVAVPPVVSGVYQISNKAQLIWFMQYVNAGNQNVDAVLTADIDMGGFKWTPMASTGLYYKTEGSDKGYAGTFDGAGHVISNFCMTASTTTEQTYGLFGTLSGTVKHLGITNVSYTFPNGTVDLRAGGIVGQMLPGSTVTDCYVRDSVIAPGQYIVGGIAACNYGGTISNCYTRNVTVSGHARCGNLVSDTRGDNSNSDRCGIVINCYTDASRVEGTQTGNKVSGCEASVSEARFASGEITYNLNGKSSSGVWKQTVGTGVPAFTGKTVYYGYLSCAADAAMGYTNDSSASTTKPNHSWADADCDTPKTCKLCGKTEGNALGHDWKAADCDTRKTCKICGKTEGNALGHSYTNGFCTVCGGYQPATGRGMPDDPYKIGNAGQLYWFADQVNSGKTYGQAELTADIVVNENVLKADGTLNEGTYRTWKPIGNLINKYSGSFDGKGYTVSGLYFNYSNSRYAGLFGYMSGGIVQNVGVVDSYISGSDYVGGVVGYKEYGAVTNCYHTGTVSGVKYVGGMIGSNKRCFVTKCYHTGTVSGKDHTGGVVGYIYSSSTVTNCYYDCTVYNGDAVGVNTGCTVTDVMGKTTEQFASGEVAYLLQGEQTEQVWGQNIDGEGEKDAYPVFSDAKVYQILNCVGAPAGYSNTEGKDAVHSYTNGFCTGCDGYEPATGSGTETDPYKIGNAGQLYWFADWVDSHNNSAWAELTADIVVNENVLKADGTLNEGTYRSWTPIGKNGCCYSGIFDGKGYTVSGLYFNDSDACDVGLFGYLESGTVQNVGVVDSYISGSDSVGSVVGYNNGTVTGCYNTGTVSGSDDVGGVVGYNKGSVTGCYNSGAVSGSDYVGGVVCYNNGTVTGCYNSGAVSGGIISGGGVVGRNYKGTVTDCYNTGTVSGSNSVGGVVGENYEGTVTGCHNTGTVSGSISVGGVVGYSEENSTVTDCYNTGTVSGSYIVGGMVGWNLINSTVTDCYNTGTVSGSDDVGGVVGWILEGCTVTGCYNMGTVSGSDYVGGVVGYNDGSTVTGCYNSGAVSGSVDVGGVVSVIYDNGTVTGCYNSGAVSGSDDVGGVVGMIYDNSTVTGCYNSGAVSGSSNYVGSVVGYIVSDSTVTNCYYDSTVYNGEAVGYDEGGTVTDVMGKTTEQFASGEVAYLLSLGCTVGEGEDAVTYPGDTWGQNIDGVGEKDAYPVFSDAKVYAILNCNNEPVGYSNTESDALVHDFSGSTVCNNCGNNAVVSVTIGGTTTHYPTMDDAFKVVTGCTAEDAAVMTILQDINLGFVYTEFQSGVFTVDLNGHIISNMYIYDIMTLRGSAVNVTITDSGEGGGIEGFRSAFNVLEGASLTISGGSIYGDFRDIAADESSSVKLVLAEGKTQGATFPGGITVERTTLNAILGEGAAYRQNGSIVVIADEATELLGDVTIGLGCVHEWIDATCVAPAYCSICKKEYGTTNPDNHASDEFVYESISKYKHIVKHACCQMQDGFGRFHYYDETTGKCVCGYEKPESYKVQWVVYDPYTGEDVGYTADVEFGADFHVPSGFDMYAEYTLVGWFTQPNGQGTQFVSGKLDTRENRTYYAHFVLGGNNGSYMIKVHCNSDDPDVLTKFTVSAPGQSLDSIAKIMAALVANDSYGITKKGHTYQGVVFYTDETHTTQYTGSYVPDDCKLCVYLLWKCDNLEFVPAADSTCKVEGNVAHYQCACGKVYADAEGTQELADPSIPVNPDAHTKQIVPAKTPTCAEAGWDAYEYCTECDYTTKVEITVDHQLTQVEAQEATCAEAGWEAYEYCTECDYTTKVEIPATGNHVDADNSGRCDVCNCLMQPAKLCMASISMNGNIAINYYMLLSDEVLSDETAYMQFTMADGEIIKIPVSQGIKADYNGETYYAFSCAVNAKEMTDDVVCQFFYEVGSTEPFTYSVQTYANNILEKSRNEDMKALVKAMLHYGAASQIHFGYNTDNLANAELEAPDYSDVSIEGFDVVSGQGTELAKFYSASLILKSETTLRFFFQVDSAATFTATYNGQTLEVKQRSGLYYVDVIGIAAKDLDEDVTITINDGTNSAEVSFNPMAYCQGVLNDTTGAFDQDTKDVVAALYLYNQAANVYFKEV